MNAVVGEEGDLVINSKWDREPVERFEDGGDMIVFTQPHHYLCSFCKLLPEFPMESVLQ